VPKQWEEVKRSLNIVDIIGSYVPLQKAGSNYRALCPFHTENTPSFMVSPQLQIFKCFGCGEGGDIFEFVKKIEGIDFPEALQILAQKAGVKIEPFKRDPQLKIKDRIYSINSMAASAFNFFLVKHKIGEKARQYLKRRGISQEIVEKFNLGYAPDSWDTVGKYLLSKGYNLSDISLAGLIGKRSGGSHFDFYRRRVMIPLMDARSRVVGFSGRVLDPKDTPKYINTIETPVFHKGEFLYGLNETRHSIKKMGWALVVEGDFGLLTLFQKGFENVAALKGTAFTQKQLEILGRYTKKIVLYLDSDEAGVQAALKSAFLAQSRGFTVKVTAGPKGVDPDELAKQDLSRFKKLVSNPKEVYDFAIDTYKDKYDLRSGSEKREFSHKVLEILAQISDPVERSHYIKKLGLILETDESLLQGLIEKFLQKPDQSLSSASSTPFAKARLTKEQYFLSLLLRAPLTVAQKRAHLAGKSDFWEKINLEIFEALKDYIAGRKSDFNPQTFVKKLSSGAQSVFENLYLADLSYLGDDINKWEKETELVLKDLKRLAIKRELRALSFGIRRSEQEGRGVAHLQKKFNELKDRLSTMN
jgi:DNA primase